MKYRSDTVGVRDLRHKRTVAVLLYLDASAIERRLSAAAQGAGVRVFAPA